MRAIGANTLNNRDGQSIHARKPRASLSGEALVIGLFRWLLLIFWLLAVLLPLMIMVSAAFKSPAELATNPLGLPETWRWSNFTDAWERSSFGQSLFNSLLITGTTLTLLVLLGAMAAYPLARRINIVVKPIYLYFLAGIMVPFQLAMLPLYRLMLSLKLINNYAGAVAIYTAISLPLVIFLYVGFIKTINQELEDAAMVDGCNPFQTFWRIIFPLLSPVTATVIIVNSINIWNDFLVALLFLQKKGLRTIPMAVFSFVGQYNYDWTAIFAAITLSVLPMIIVFLILQRYFIKGLAAGAVKG